MSMLMALMKALPRGPAATRRSAVPKHAGPPMPPFTYTIRHRTAAPRTSRSASTRPLGETWRTPPAATPESVQTSSRTGFARTLRVQRGRMPCSAHAGNARATLDRTQGHCRHGAQQRVPPCRPAAGRSRPVQAARLRRLSVGTARLLKEPPGAGLPARPVL
jgi:hypothetical protein